MQYSVEKRGFPCGSKKSLFKQWEMESGGVQKELDVFLHKSSINI